MVQEKEGKGSISIGWTRANFEKAARSKEMKKRD